MKVMPTTQEAAEKILKGAIELLERHDWCKGAMARNAQGHPVTATSLQAESFCLMGAIRKASDQLNFGVRSQYQETAESILKTHIQIATRNPIETIHTWNDEVCRNKKQALDMLVEAYAKS